MPNAGLSNRTDAPAPLVSERGDSPRLGAPPPRPPIPPQAIALTFWLIVAIAVTVKTVASPGIHTLFPKFAGGAEHWLAGQSLYASDNGQGAFRYSPTFAIFMIPFEALGLRAGGVLWSWVNIGVLLYGLRRFICDVMPAIQARTQTKRSGPVNPDAREVALLTLTLIAAHRSIWNAQSHVLVCGLMLLACSAVIRGRYWWAAGLLTLPILFKLSPLAPALLLVALYPRALGARLAIALVVASALPFLTQRPAYVCSQYAEWFRYLGTSSTQRWPSFRDAWTVWELIAGGIHLPAYRALQLTAAGGVFGACMLYARPAASARVRVTTATALGLGYVMLFGPAVEYPTLTLLAPFTAWAMAEALDARFHRLLAVGGYVLAVFLGMGAFQRATQDHLPLTAAALPVGSFLTLVWTVLYARAAARAGK